MKLFPFCLPFIFAVLVLVTSCTTASGPQPFTGIIHGSVHSAILGQGCAQAFPMGRWQFVHSIDFTMAGGRGGSVIGVTVLDGKILKCALITIEGLTLFEARLKDKLVVLRDLPPFDKPGFAGALMADVQAMFIRPGVEDNDIQYGYFGDNRAGCRFISAGDRVTDIIPLKDGCWRIYSHAGAQEQGRTIIARSCILHDGYRLPHELELQVSGPRGYTLKMTLISAEKL
jgi:hypothetical protein